MYSLSAVLSYGPIVAAEGNMAVTWNESLTFNSWLLTDDGSFLAVDCCTLGDVPTLEGAKEHAAQWLTRMADEGNDD